MQVLSFRARGQVFELCASASDVLFDLSCAGGVICNCWQESNSDRFEMNIMNRESKSPYWQHGTKFLSFLF